MDQLLAAAPKDSDGHPQFPFINFQAASFEVVAQFSRCTFTTNVHFGQVDFVGNAEFGATRFIGQCSFSSAEFFGRLFMKQSRMEAGGIFDHCRFNGLAGLNIAESKGTANFDGANFKSYALFTGTWLDLTLDQCTLAEAKFGLTARRVSLGDAQFEAGRDLGWITSSGALLLKNTSFRQAFRIQLIGQAIRGDLRTESSAHIDFLGDLDLQEADLGGPTLITRVSPEALAATNTPSEQASLPCRILGLSLTDLKDVTLGAVDISACLFTGAHHIEALRIEPAASWTAAPVNRWSTRRRVVADEVQWRSRYEDSDAWKRADASLQAVYQSAFAVTGSDGVRPMPAAPTADHVASVYRSLRKGREDQNDSPGAADFYYGEMEMRRKAAGLRSPEGWLLNLYWVTSGYALRAWRAFLSLILLIIVCGVLFTAWGFDRTPVTQQNPSRIDFRSGTFEYERRSPELGVWDGIGYACQASTSLLRTPERQPLTAKGQVAEIFLRLAGPALLALGLLSLRGRVKR
jgi:hypothetical protein